MKSALVGPAVIVALSALPAWPTGCQQVSHALGVRSRVAAVEEGLMPAFSQRATTPAGMSLTERMAHYYTPGVGIAVINNGEIEWAKGYGVVTAGSADEVTADHLFQACSISKPIAAIGVMTLSQSGRIAIDRPVNDYLASWKVPDNAFTATEKVTIRRLLSHTGGIGVSGFDGYPAGRSIPTLLQILDGVPPAINHPVRVEAVPGSVYSYSGGGMEILHRMVEDVTGVPFKEYMDDHVLSRMKMSSSGFLQPLLGPLADRAVFAHDFSGNRLAGGWRTYPELAAAGLWATPSDLGRVILEVQRAAKGRGKVLSADTVAEMLATQAIKEDGGKMGLGFEVTPLGRDVRFSHTGDNVGFKAYLIGYRDSGKGAVVMTNSENGGALMLEIMRGISKVYDWPDMAPKPIDLVDVPPDVLPAYVGGYGLAGGGIVYEVAMSGSEKQPDPERSHSNQLHGVARPRNPAGGEARLGIRFPGIGPVLYELYPVAADRFVFFCFMGEGSVAFTRDGAGRVDGMIIDLGGGTIRVTKL